jgi:hypothetical protein
MISRERTPRYRTVLVEDDTDTDQKEDYFEGDPTTDRLDIVNQPAAVGAPSRSLKSSGRGAQRATAALRNASRNRKARTNGSKAVSLLAPTSSVMTSFAAAGELAPVAVVTRQHLTQTYAVTSSGAGFYNLVIGTDPSVAIDWSSFAAAFSAYRTVSVTVTFLPSNQYSKTTTNCSPGFVVTDWENIAALSTMASAASYPDSGDFVTLENGWCHRLAVPDRVPYNTWNDVATAVNYSFVKTYFEGLSVSTTFGRLYVEWEVDLLGRT